jgi:TPR repeat protein
VQSSAADARITYLLIAIIVVLLVVAVGIYSWLGLSSTVLGTASDEIGAIDALAAATIERSTPSPTSSNPARNKVNKSRNQRSTSRHDAPQKSRLSAEELFRQAAVQNDPAAQYELGMAYADGTGRQKDIVSAYVWLVLARANGDLRSEPVLRSLVPNLTRSQVAAIRVALANMYTRGVGVAPDKVKAYTWLNLAEAAGSTEAAALKKELEPSLSSRKIASANSRSQQLLSHP